MSTTATREAQHEIFWRSQLREILGCLIDGIDESAVASIAVEADWIEVRAGETVRPQQASDAQHLFIVLSGDLEVISTAGALASAVERVRRGDMIGDIALLAQELWNENVRAVRDSVLARFDGAVFTAFCHQYPHAWQSVARAACRRFQRRVGPRLSLRAAASTVAILPLHPAARDFARRLSTAMRGAVLHLDPSDVERRLPTIGTMPHDDPVWLALSSWLDRQELTHRSVIYEADTSASNWTRSCLHRANHVLFVASAHSEPSIGDVERAAMRWVRPTSAQRHSLVLLHENGDRRPRLTSRWLQSRHVNCVYHVRGNQQADFDRLARILSGEAVGLALGGGGARGLAHVGVIRALEEAGIPIDIVGGTSVGAIVAAQYAMGVRWDDMLAAFRAFGRMRPHRDFTLPLIGFNRGRIFDRTMQLMFQDTCLEDLWIECFGISTNLSSATMVVHERGLVRKMLRASCALPGVTVPAVERGDLLVDGGMLNRVPGDVMRERCGTVIAVDVSATNSLRVDEAHEQIPSAGRVLFSRLNPFQRSLSVPTIVEIVERAMALGSVERNARVARDADLYLRPPVGHFRRFDVRSFETILEAGYLHARREIEAWRTVRGAELSGHR